MPQHARIDAKLISQPDRAARSYLSDLAAAPQEVRLNLLAALCWRRRTASNATQIRDAKVSVGTVHKVLADHRGSSD